MNNLVSFVPGINIEDIPEDIAELEVWDELDVNGGNCFSVEKDSRFGNWLQKNNVVFTESWQWIVVWR